MVTLWSVVTNFFCSKFNKYALTYHLLIVFLPYHLLLWAKIAYTHNSLRNDELPAGPALILKSKSGSQLLTTFHSCSHKCFRDEVSAVIQFNK